MSEQKAPVSSSAADEEPRKIKVYTRTGDKGTSMLFNGERREKSDPSFMALGDVDELNAYAGLALEHCKLSEGDGFQSLVSQLVTIQSRLFDVGSAIATPLSTSDETQTSRVAFDEANVDSLEQWIDQMEDHLPPLRNFILPVRVVSIPRFILTY
jgi:ATP:cob(I)alamin adenosyltransferase